MSLLLGHSPKQFVGFQPVLGLKVQLASVAPHASDLALWVDRKLWSLAGWADNWFPSRLRHARDYAKFQLLSAQSRANEAERRVNLYRNSSVRVEVVDERTRNTGRF